MRHQYTRIQMKIAKVAYYIFFLLHLRLLMCIHGSVAAMEMNTTQLELTERNVAAGYQNVIRLPSDSHIGEDNNNNEAHGHRPSSSSSSSSTSRMHHHMMNPDELMVFFTLEGLKVGKKMPIYFPRIDPSNSPPLLSREEAESIPFSYKDLPYLLQLFSLSYGSPQATAVEVALKQCEARPITGETKFCATSPESMLDFVRAIFGWGTKFQVLATTHFANAKADLQNYTILEEPKEVPTSKMAACHTLSYPYAIFYCHSVRDVKILKVSLADENGGRTEAIAVCHMDTSHWERDFVAFNLLGVEPGSSDVCHFFPSDHMVYVETY